MITLITCLVAYCVICALIIALVPAVRNTWKTAVRDLYMAIQHKKIKHVLNCWIVVGKVFFYAPLLLMRYKKRKKEYLNSIKNQAGTGTINCKACGHKEHVIFGTYEGEQLIDYYYDSVQVSDSQTGYQCQSCGKFHILNSQEERNNRFTCSCGGLLSREKHMFCPQCKSKKVLYHQIVEPSNNYDSSKIDLGNSAFCFLFLYIFIIVTAILLSGLILMLIWNYLICLVIPSLPTIA